MKCLLGGFLSNLSKNSLFSFLTKATLGVESMAEAEDCGMVKSPNEDIASHPNNTSPYGIWSESVTKRVVSVGVESASKET